MSLISAGLKLIARTANDMLLNHSTQRAKKIAYQETGKAMRQANRKGYYIDGAKAYRKITIKTLPLQKQSTKTATSLSPNYNSFECRKRISAIGFSFLIICRPKRTPFCNERYVPIKGVKRFIGYQFAVKIPARKLIIGQGGNFARFPRNACGKIFAFRFG